MITRRRLITGLAVGAIGAGAAGTVITAGSEDDTGDRPGDASSGEGAERSITVATATVERRTLSESKELSAQVTYGGPYELPLARTGTVTSVPAAQTVIGFGDEIVRVDLKPTFLAEGNLPMFRELKRTPDVRVSGQKYMLGYDVAQLQTFLISKGFDEDGDLAEPDLEFGPVTERAVKAWQKANGWPRTGRVDATQLVFAPAPVRLHMVPRVGAMFSTIQVTEPDQKITMAVQNRDRGLVTVGADVEITSPDGTAATGTIDKIERTLNQEGQSVNTATIVPATPLPPDATSATVMVARVLADDALSVPIRALLAVQEGGFAVEMATVRPDGSPDLRRVEVGAVADGWAAVTGDLDAGDTVVVAQ